MDRMTASPLGSHPAEISVFLTKPPSGSENLRFALDRKSQLRGTIGTGTPIYANDR